jgi:hypothetical protein
MDTIQKHILSYFDDLDYDNANNSKDKLRIEINELNKQFKSTIESARQMVQSGYFLIYFDDIREFLQSIDKKYKTLSDNELWDKYIDIIAKNIKDILNYKV